MLIFSANKQSTHVCNATTLSLCFYRFRLHGWRRLLWWHQAQQVATGAELLVQESWGCFWVPAGTPKDVIDKIFVAARQAHETTAVREFYDASGTDVLLSKSPAEFAAFMRAETEKWQRVVQLVGVKAP